MFWDKVLKNGLLVLGTLTLLQESALFCQGEELNQTITYTYANLTQFCQRHVEVEIGNRSLKNALEGLEIRAALFDYQAPDGVISDDSIAVQFLDAVASRAGFTWRDSYGILPTPEDYDEALYSAIREYDIMGEWYTRTIQRLSDSILFPEGFYDASFILVAKKQQDRSTDSVNLWSFLDPFTLEVWIVMGATVIVSAFTFYLIMRLEQTGVGFGDSIFISIFSFTGHFHFNPRKSASRIFSIAVCAFALIIVAIYTANLASFFIVRAAPPETFKGLEDVIRQQKKLCTLRESASSDFLERNYKGISYIGTESESQDYLGLDDGICDVSLVSRGTWNVMQRSAKHNSGCKKEWVGRTVSNQEGGFAMLDSSTMCTSLLRDVFEFYMIQMKQDGTCDEIWENYLNNPTADYQDCTAIEAAELSQNEDEASNLQLGLESVGGVFILHLINMVITLGLAFGIYFYKKRWGKYSAGQDGGSNDSTIQEDGLDVEEANMGKQEIRFDPGSQIGFFSANYGLNGPIHPLASMGRKQRPESNARQLALEKKLDQHTRQLEQLLARFDAAVPLTSSVRELDTEKAIDLQDEESALRPGPQASSGLTSFTSPSSTLSLPGEEVDPNGNSDPSNCDGRSGLLRRKSSGLIPIPSPSPGQHRKHPSTADSGKKKPKTKKKSKKSTKNAT